MPEPVRVLVVDDHEVVRRGVAQVMEAEDGVAVVAEATSVRDAVTRAAAARPDVAVIDLKLPDGTGTELVRRLREALPGLRCVVLSAYDDEDARLAALDAGACAFVAKSARGPELIDAVRAVAAGRRLLTDRTVAQHRAGQGDPVAALTPTERRVLELIGDGLSNREIGERLGLAEKTVKNHTTALLAKLGFRRRTQAAAWVVARRSSSAWAARPGAGPG